MPETTALGAAMAAGAAEGVSVWSLNPEDLSEVTSEKFEPQINTDGTPSPHHPHPQGGVLAAILTKPACVCRERISLRTLEEGGAEIHELGDHRTSLQRQRYAAPRPPSSHNPLRHRYKQPQCVQVLQWELEKTALTRQRFD